VRKEGSKEVKKEGIFQLRAPWSLAPAKTTHFLSVVIICYYILYPREMGTQKAEMWIPSWFGWVTPNNFHLNLCPGLRPPMISNDWNSIIRRGNFQLFKLYIRPEHCGAKGFLEKGWTRVVSHQYPRELHSKSLASAPHLFNRGVWRPLKTPCLVASSNSNARWHVRESDNLAPSAPVTANDGKLICLP
jgi:hypothetical protein